TTFMLGFAVAQLFHGPLSDRFGRKPVLVTALSLYAATNVLAAFSGSFEMRLISRAASRAAGAAGQVGRGRRVRDCIAGRAMARVRGRASMVFRVVPVSAPAFAQVVVMIFGDWRLIFGGVAVVAALVLVWFTIRMPETLDR